MSYNRVTNHFATSAHLDTPMFSSCLPAPSMERGGFAWVMLKETSPICSMTFFTPRMTQMQVTIYHTKRIWVSYSLITSSIYWLEVFLINELWGVHWEEVDHNKKIASKVTVKSTDKWDNLPDHLETCLGSVQVVLGLS